MALPARSAFPDLRPHSETVVHLPRKSRSSLVLRRVCRVTQGIVVLLSGATLFLYAATVGVERRWQKQYDYLLRLRQQRQELMAATATLQHHLRQSPRPGTIVPTPAQTVFITPAPARPPRPLPKPSARPWPVEGY
ncbi:MAG: hypothetical protein RMI89_04710 [Gloeomargarita sp. SKYBB_i_bin120]|nr:hypothetical protein [Gloeomargarita sp. SKYG98]MCS7292262.1 hypothetical protein [Gloeomargarita sp. SKYB120]MDW8177823.1 hypothetical protein [Gloeomargarita sp. SKYBB_i_bin120]